MAQFKYVAVTAEGTKLRATTEAMSADALRNELLGRQLEVKKISEKKTFSKIEITKQKVKRGDHALLPPDRCLVRWHPDRDAIETVRERRTTGSGRSSDRRADPDRHPVLGGAGPSPRRVPTYYIGILRSAEITVSSTSCSTSSRTSSVTSSRARR
jgi:hypothetical protein